VLRQQLLDLLEEGVDITLEDTAVTCEASPESAATDWEIRNKVSSQKWKRPGHFLLKICWLPKIYIHIMGASVANKLL